LTIKERKGDEIEDNNNSVKYKTPAKNVLRAERSDKETREEGADDYQAPRTFVEITGEKETRAEPVDTYNYNQQRWMNCTTV
jgi:protein subunit release factor A